MYWLFKFLMGSFIICVFIGTSFCQKANDTNLTEEQKKIIVLYISEVIAGPNDYLFYQSVTKKELFRYLEPPLTRKKLKPKAATDQKFEEVRTWLTQKKLKTWSKQIVNYKQGKWNQQLFPEGTKFIRKNEIPDWRRHSGIPPPGEDVMVIYHISKPFIIDKKYALVYVRYESGPANVNVGYIYFTKNDGVWHIKTDARLNATT